MSFFDSDVIDPVSSVASNLPLGDTTEYFRPEVELRSTNDATFDIANALANKNVQTRHHKLAEPVNNKALEDALEVLATYDKTKLEEYKKKDQVIQGIYVIALAGEEPLQHRALYIGHYARKPQGKNPNSAAENVYRAFETLAECRHLHNANEPTKKNNTTDEKCRYILKMLKQTKRPIVVHILDTARKFDPENWEGVLLSTQPPNSCNIDARLYGTYKRLNANSFAEHIWQILKSEPTLIYEHEVGKKKQESGVFVCILCEHEMKTYITFTHHLRRVHPDIPAKTPKQSNLQNRKYKDYYEMKKKYCQK